MPSNLIGIAILIAALAPGFAYLQAYRRYALRDARSQTTEIVEMGAVGGLATLAAALTVLVAAKWVPGLIGLETLLKGASTLRGSAWATVLSASVTLLLSVAACIGTGVLLGRRSRHAVGSVREGVVFVKALTARSPDGREPYLAVELNDGRLVEGYLLYASVNEDPARRDIVLQKPIAWSGVGYCERTRSAAESAYVPGSLIKVVHISYPPSPAPQDSGTGVGPDRESA
ncbi:DUF6338 family protein [Thermomonospora cellulosilytica]|uniref:Uncharacterized protein n=1 Tax=Thermomonospora cellulosilytica TaxID=1411118 RepID=A0A7W3N0K4_9ACTN|nr:DUF6338 family protein [Thermomonospora cellulosilytica]MBA9005333.1 hypothetical protein [Thermomonospora cellulosilytica]